MAVKFKEMVKGATLTGAAASLYTSPVLTAASIQAATCYNPTAGAITLSIYKVPAGSAADSSTLICTRSVPAATTMQPVELINHKLEAGTAIYAVGASLTLNISGVEYIPD